MSNVVNRTEPESYQDFELLPARLAAVVRSPQLLFTRVIVRPRWADVMLLTLAVSAGCGVAFAQTDVGRRALVDQWERTAVAFGREIDDARYAELVRISENGAAYAVASAVASGPLLTAAVAAVIFGVFTGLMREQARYTQVLAVAAHAGVVLAIRQLVATPLNFSRETTASATTLTLVFPMLDEASAPARFFGAIDLFVVWWVVVLAVGVALLYGRSARATVFAFMGAYVGVAALLAVAMAVSGGTV